MGLASLVYISAKVCQVLLRYTSFSIRRQNALKKIGHEPSGGQILKSQKISVFKMLSCWITSSNGNRLSKSNCTQHLLFANSIFKFIIHEC